MAFSGNDLRPGMVIIFQGKLWRCLEAVHKTPGNKRAFVQAKLRNVVEGNQLVHKFSSTEELERASLRERTMQFLYVDGEVYHFMDIDNYEQVDTAHSRLKTSLKQLFH